MTQEMVGARGAGQHWLLGTLMLLAVWLFAGANHAQAQRRSATVGQERAAKDELRFKVYVRPLAFYPDPLAERNAQTQRMVHQTIRAFLGFLPEDSLKQQAPEKFVDVRSLQKAVARYFSNQDERFVVIPNDDLLLAIEREALLTDSGGQSVLRIMIQTEQAKALKEEGVRALSRADLETAEIKLMEAARLYESVQGEFLYPVQMSEIYEYLALVYDEMRNRGQELDQETSARFEDALERMVRLTPEKKLVYPFYASSLERAWRQARAAVLKSRRSGRDRVDLLLAERVGQLLDANVVVWGYVTQKGGQLELTLHMHRQDKPELEAAPPERIRLPVGKTARFERAQRLASRFAACIEPLPEPPAPVVDREKGHFYLDSTFSYLVYLNPEQTRFDNFGFSLSGSYMLSDNFALMSRVSIMVGGSDVEGDLLSDDFNSVRSFLGGAFSLRTGLFRPFVTFSVEANRISRFERTDNFFCKINRDAPACGPDDIESKPPGWLIGINSQLGTALNLYRDLFMTVSGNFTFYSLPFEDKPVDLPLGLDAGLEYRF